MPWPWGKLWGFEAVWGFTEKLFLLTGPLLQRNSLLPSSPDHSGVTVP